jgi:uncharacterized OsmC-like protein
MTAQNALQINDRFNGVDVNHVLGLIGGIEQVTDRSKFQFRLNNRWIDGGHNRSNIKEYFANGQEDVTRTTPFIVDADEPAVSGGSDSAPNPMEFVLHALASCLTSTMVYHASVQGIEIKSVESSLTGNMDVRGMLGMSDQVRKGYDRVKVSMSVNSTADAASLTELALFSPVYDIISKSLQVDFELKTI